MKAKQTVYFYYLTRLNWVKTDVIEGKEDEQHRPGDLLVALKITEIDHYAVNTLMYDGQVVYRCDDRQSIEVALKSAGVPEPLRSRLIGFNFWSDEVQGDGFRVGNRLHKK